MISLIAKAEDTCNKKPEEHLLDLPQGCHTEENGMKINRVNIGRCDKRQCITSNLSNPVGCFDTWLKHCCSVNKTEQLTVNCTRFLYTITKTVSCKCRECLTLTQVSGEIYGMQNDLKVPFKVGKIYIKGQLAGETNDYGYFSLTIPGDDNEVVLEVKNDVEKKFMDTIKTVKTSEDDNIFVHIVVPIKPTPILFNANIGHSMPLSSKNQAPFSHISFPSDSIVTEDGKPFKGIVKAFVHFMDPRNLNDIESVYGSVSTVGEDGIERPLETYGMISYVFNDEKGKNLKLNSPVTCSIDASTFNISIDGEGNSDVYAWFLDLKIGKWTQSNRFQVQQEQTGRRRLLSTKTLEVQVPPQPDIKYKEILTKLTNQSKIITYVRYYRTSSGMISKLNIDSKTQIITVKNVTERNRVDACVVAVKVYQDTSFQLPLRTPVSVTSITYNPSNSKYSGKDTQITNENGIACLTIFCNQNVTLYAQQSQSPVDLVTSNTHSLPESYNRQNINKNTRVMFEAIERYYDPIAKKYSPVRFYREKSQCLNPSRDDYHFQFAPLIKPDHFSPFQNDKVHNNILSWYPDPKDKPERRACFVKVRLTVSITKFPFCLLYFYS